MEVQPDSKVVTHPGAEAHDGCQVTAGPLHTFVHCCSLEELPRLGDLGHALLGIANGGAFVHDAKELGWSPRPLLSLGNNFRVCLLVLLPLVQGESELVASLQKQLDRLDKNLWIVGAQKDVVDLGVDVETLHPQ